MQSKGERYDLSPEFAFELAAYFDFHVGNSRATDVGEAHTAGIHSVLIPQSSTADSGSRPDCLLGSLHGINDNPT